MIDYSTLTIERNFGYNDKKFNKLKIILLDRDRSGDQQPIFLLDWYFSKKNGWGEPVIIWYSTKHRTSECENILDEIKTVIESTNMKESTIRNLQVIHITNSNAKIPINLDIPILNYIYRATT